MVGGLTDTKLDLLEVIYVGCGSGQVQMWIETERNSGARMDRDLELDWECNRDRCISLEWRNVYRTRMTM